MFEDGLQFVVVGSKGLRQSVDDARRKLGAGEVPPQLLAQETRRGRLTEYDSDNIPAVEGAFASKKKLVAIVVDAFALGGAVFKVDPVTGTQTTLSSGGSFGRPVALTIVAAICGNGTVEPGEDCDRGAANGTSTSCCANDCTFKTANATCRQATGPCDAVERCGGDSATCPSDRKSTDVCRLPTNECDALRK